MANDAQIAIKAVLLKYMPIKDIESCFQDMIFHINTALKHESLDMIKKYSKDQMVSILKNDGYLVIPPEKNNKELK